MKTRYYRAEFGNTTFYRATKTRLYHSLVYRASGEWGFSFKQAAGAGTAPAVEVTEAEFRAIQARRNEWLTGRGLDPKDFSAPNCSYVPSAMLEGVPVSADA